MCSHVKPMPPWFWMFTWALVTAASDATVHAACAEDVRGGDYFGPGGWLEIGGPPAPAKLNPAARDEALARRLWELSQAMTGVRLLADDPPQ